MLFQQQHTSAQRTSRTQTYITQQTATILASQSTCIYKQYKSRLTCHANHNHRNTKIIHNNTTRLTQYTTHKPQNRRDQTVTSILPHTTKSHPNTITYPIPTRNVSQINQPYHHEPFSASQQSASTQKAPLTTKITPTAIYCTPQTLPRCFILH